MTTGTAVATTVGVNRGVMYVDPKQMNTSKAKKYLAKVAGSRAPFIGTQLKTDGQAGTISVGFGKTAKAMKNPELVLNVPQTLSAWQYWPENGAPSYPFIVPVFGDLELPPRDKCGPAETKHNELKNADEDVWREVMVLILRDPDTNEQYHLVCDKPSTLNPAAEFVLGFADEEKISQGKLPVVALDFEKVKTKKGQSYYKLALEVVEWVKATKADAPDTLAQTHAKQAAEAEADAKAARDLDDDKPARGRRNRDEDEDADEAPKSRMNAKDKKDLERARRTADDAEVEEVDHRKGNGSRHDPRNNPPTADDMDEAPRRSRRNRDEDDSQDDDRPVVRSRTQKPSVDEDEAPRRGRKAAAAAADDQDDDDEAEARAAVRRRRVN